MRGGANLLRCSPKACVSCRNIAGPLRSTAGVWLRNLLRSRVDFWMSFLRE
jgi:hypothetical protein